MVIAARDLPAGAVLGPNDLVRARVQVPEDVLDGLIPGDDASQLVGRTLVERVWGGKTSHARKSAMLRACSNSSGC